MPDLFIIAGCNGAGKTTASYTMLPEIFQVKEFVNADEIARGLSPFKPEGVAIQAGKIMLNRIKELINLKENFAIETTLTTLFYQQTIKSAQASGYSVSLIFFWLNDVNLAIERVKLRVKEGGHHIPEEIIRRRYTKGIKNLFKIFIPITDKWVIINSSEKNYMVVTENGKGSEIIIHDKRTWEIIKTQSE